MKNLSIVTALLFAFAASPALGDDGAKRLRVKLSGYEETPNTLSSPGVGAFEARISRNEDSISWELSYRDIPTPVLQAHIHFGQRALSGGISIFLCTNLGNAPAGTVVAACPAAGGTVGGVITAADVIGPAGQGIAPGELAEIIAAIRAGYAYVNIHSQQFPTGELRGQFDDRDEGRHRGHRD
jgi:hypothetical protein